MASLIPLEHPGILLKEEFIESLEITAYAVSKGTGIPQTALSEIIKGKRNISAINALKLSKFFGVSENFFMNIQAKYDLDLAKEIAKVEEKLPSKLHQNQGRIAAMAQQDEEEQLMVMNYRGRQQQRGQPNPNRRGSYSPKKVTFSPNTYRREINQTRFPATEGKYPKGSCVAHPWVTNHNTNTCMMYKRCINHYKEEQPQPRRGGFFRPVRNQSGNKIAMAYEEGEFDESEVAVVADDDSLWQQDNESAENDNLN